MTWINETEIRWLAARDRDARIEEHATDIYEALWAQVMRDLNDVKSIERFAGLTTNGRQLAHIISFPVDASPSILSMPRSLQITLEKDEHRIVATGQHPELEIVFEIGVCESDGAVCLMVDGKKISYEDASRRALTAFLYPGLPTR